MAEVTVADFAKVLKVPVDRLLEQLDEAGIKVGGPNDVISEDAKLELLTHLKKNHGRKDATDSAPRRITLSRKSQSELKLASGQGRARTINVEVRQKRTYIKRDVLEEQARKQQEELDAARRAEEQARTAVDRAAQEEIERRAAAERERLAAEQREVDERKRAEDEQRRAAAADEAARARADEERRKATLAEKESQQRADAERARQKAKKERLMDEPAEGDHTLHVADGMAGRRKKKKQRRRSVPVSTDPQHGFEKPTEPIVREVEIGATITVSDLAQRMAVKANEVIKSLMKMGMMVTINQVLDQDTATLVVEEMGHAAKPLKDVAIEDELIESVAQAASGAEAVTRAPVVTIMGHVDHGKTSLLDYIRRTRVAAGEAGGITQHIGAYNVETPKGRITFLDTPGHAAFTAMRARGAKVTDIVVLVVAADDGVMPQTVEAINHARAGKVPLIVAVNKIDKPDANPQRVRTELLQHEIQVESLGGETLEVEVSATKKTNLDKLLDIIALQAEVLDLKANPDRPAEGTVVEAKLDRGRGPVATVLVQRGTLKVGDIVVAGSEWGRARALINDQGQQVPNAGPSTPVEVLGFAGTPEAGDRLAVVESEARAREITDYRQRQRREKASSGGKVGGSLEQMMSQLKTAGRKEFPLVVKADVQGSVEAIIGALDKLATDEVAARVLH
ncbi:MAG TPA: translation initiation factor IF-2, partial [Gammaproteobacteria bacterium]|nr:translation initiation factor IF-2 [Gammaproteobacteria bacterium]